MSTSPEPTSPESESLDPLPLEHQHTAEAIAQRLQTRQEHNDLGDFVLGAVDGTVTTFAIVAGVAGASFSVSVALVLGLANVLADGFSMAVGNYLKARSDGQLLERYRRLEGRHIDQTPEGEREELRQIFAAKGFSGEALEHIVEIISSDRECWINTMLAEEWGLQIDPPSPIRSGLITFAAFLAGGLVPIVPLLFGSLLGTSLTYLSSAAAAGVAFLVIGAIRGKVTDHRLLYSSLETLAIGGVAAALAFGVGWLFQQLAGGG